MTEWNPAHRRPRRSPASGCRRGRRAAEVVTARGTGRPTALDDPTRRNTAALAARSTSRPAPDGTEAAGGPDLLALESGRRRIHARIDARFTMAPPRRWTILVTRSDEK
ncbi:hypothetical protein ACWENS_41225 [Streptomyces sp. NPDC004532]|uniref:hypothetical protein n=1 Tax=Streptomyces sp. EKR5.2 TaxID=3461014 RepID=UPI0040413F06